MALATSDEPQSAGPEDVSSLLARASAGDGDAWRDVLERYGPRVFALVRSRCRSPELAEEITQSVFVTIATKMTSGQYAERGRFESWLFRVAMNRVRDEARRIKRQAVPLAPETLGPLAGTAEDEARTVDGIDPGLARLREAIGALNPQDQEIIHLRHHAQLSFRQIADLLDEPLGTLLARHHRALKKLRAMLVPDAEESS